jgi:hypothetical protein
VVVDVDAAGQVQLDFPPGPAEPQPERNEPALSE